MALRRFWVALLVCIAVLGVSPAFAQAPVARAVLFYSPTCPHCHTVLDEVLPPLQARYGSQLHILTIDVTTPSGKSLYSAALQTFAVPAYRQGVPALFFDQTHLVGSDEIPDRLPGLIEQALATGGNAWPAIPGIEPLTATFEAGAAPVAPPASSPFSRDPFANTLALLVLTGMAIAFFVAVTRLRWPFDRPLPVTRSRWIPVLAAVGVVLAGYLAFVELNQQSAVCGPVGDCNAVHQSPYARLFGVPVGVIGLAGYLAIIVAWLLDRFANVRLARQALVVMALAGTLFSLYLTFLEPFVIGATCAWCLLSAITMTTLLWLVAAPAPQHVARGRRSLATAKGR
ncbi:vitamin K epoxide reductase [Chloroflexus islandicus]|uniref:Vitamin K epoxide reductase n=1 Tax=Chloroflexus islandicus TaxID=1707952 RepID=A0A178LRE9_9CHLR|nr:vitamin K epoxide reductase family protein [Chloroflexus islandicus]OAN36347.1 vitamin K epoxide reductase [Chloroflexus islandicus]